MLLLTGRHPKARRSAAQRVLFRGGAKRTLLRRGAAHLAVRSQSVGHPRRGGLEQHKYENTDAENAQNKFCGFHFIPSNKNEPEYSGSNYSKSLLPVLPACSGNQSAAPHFSRGGSPCRLSIRTLNSTPATRDTSITPPLILLFTSIRIMAKFFIASWKAGKVTGRSACRLHDTSQSGRACRLLFTDNKPFGYLNNFSFRILSKFLAPLQRFAGLCFGKLNF